MHPLPRWLHTAVLAVILTAVAGLLFLAAMQRGLNHDEHQFVAPGLLIAREGKLPYRDFPMFHLPNLALLYALLDLRAHDPVLAAKLVGVVSSTLTAAFILLAATRRRAENPLLRRHLAFGVAAVLLLLSDQLFTYTAGKTWNHELPAMLLLAGILLQVRALETQTYLCFAFSGLCVGLAIGTRLTYLPAALAFPAFLFISPLPRHVRTTGTGLWIIGCGLAMLPTLYFYTLAPERFIFDNLQFPRLRLTDVTDTRAQKTMIWWRKFRYFFKEIVPYSLPLIAAFLIALFRFDRFWPRRHPEAQPAGPTSAWARLVSTWSNWRGRIPENFGLALTLTVLPMAILGCFLPSRYQYQHYFIFTPLIALAIAYATRLWTRSTPRLQLSLLALATLIAVSPINANSRKAPGGVLAYRSVVWMLDPWNWFTTRLRSDYGEDRGTGVTGKYLTLAPIGILECKGRIYPEFATGPFAWRAAALIPPEKRAKLGFIAPEDLPRFLDADPPAAIVTGVEDPALEKPFIDYAESHHFSPSHYGGRYVMWNPSLPPRPSRKKLRESLPADAPNPQP